MRKLASWYTEEPNTVKAFLQSLSKNKYDNRDSTKS